MSSKYKYMTLTGIGIKLKSEIACILVCKSLAVAGLGDKVN